MLGEHRREHTCDKVSEFWNQARNDKFTPVVRLLRGQVPENHERAQIIFSLAFYFRGTRNINQRQEHDPVSQLAGWASLLALIIDWSCRFGLSSDVVAETIAGLEPVRHFASARSNLDDY